MASKSGGTQSAKTKKGRPKSLIFLKTLFAMSIICTGLLVTYVIMMAFKSPLLSDDIVQVNGENIENIDDNTKIASVGKNSNDDTIHENIFIEGVDVSRLTKQQAVKLLSEKFTGVNDDEIILSYNNGKYTEKFSSFNAKYDIEKAVDEAYDYGRSGTSSERNKAVSALKKNPLKIEMSYLYDDLLIAQKVDGYAQELDIAPKEPGLSRVDGEFITSPGTAGKAIDKEQLISDIKAILDSKQGGTVKINSYESKPKYKEEDFAKATDLLGSFTTNFVAGATNRNQNIKTAASKINNFVLMPDEVFSTNKEFGATTYENGYRVAGTYLDGKIVDGMGGGMCQVSTTLYMALLHAEAEIVERVNHSMKVGYVDYAYDATLAGDYIDLKFKNNTDYPITIESVMTNKSVTVNIYGYETRSAGRKLKFENALVSTTQPEAEKVTEDPTLPLNTRAVDVEQKIGYKYELYKLVYENDVLIDRKRVNTSTYRPVRAQVRLGTGPPAPTPDPVQPDPAQPEPTPEPIVQTDPVIIDPPPPSIDDLPFMP